MSETVFTKDAGRFLKPDETKAFKETYRSAKLACGQKDTDITHSEFLGLTKLTKLLEQPGCVGLRIHYANRWEDENDKATETGKGQLKPRIFLTAVDASGKDLPIPADPRGLKDDAGEGDELAVGDGPVCPRHCA